MVFNFCIRWTFFLFICCVRSHEMFSFQSLKSHLSMMRTTCAVNKIQREKKYQRIWNTHCLNQHIHSFIHLNESTKKAKNVDRFFDFVDGIKIFFNWVHLFSFVLLLYQLKLKEKKKIILCSTYVLFLSSCYSFIFGIDESYILLLRRVTTKSQ